MGALGKPVMLFACPTCSQLFRRCLPDIPGQFRYRRLEGNERRSRRHPAESPEGIPVCVFDPCASRDEPQLQETVRDLVRAAGFQVAPLPMERDRAQCCSWGGQISIASPGYATEIARAGVRQSPHPYVTYCINCRDIFASAGKPVYHLLDLLLEINGPHRPPPTLTDKIGHMTFWAEYRPSENAAQAPRFELVNGYGHRMEIIEE